MKKFIEEMSVEEYLIYLGYNSIKPIDRSDYYHAVSQRNLFASVGVKENKFEDHYPNWFQKYLDNLQEEEDIQRRLESDWGMLKQFEADFKKSKGIGKAKAKAKG